MQVDVIPHAAAINPAGLNQRTVVVVDVLRASSTILSAVKNGALYVIPESEIENAVDLYKSHGSDLILAGERNAQKVNGFHMGNSPLEFTSAQVDGKGIILTTTNGTRAIRLCQQADEVLIGCFLNAKTVAEYLISQELPATVICSGTENQYSMDDGMCAAYILDLMSKQIPIETTDAGYTMWQAFQSKNGDLNELLRHCKHLNYLYELGKRDDVDYCLNKDIINMLVSFEDGKLVKKE